MYLSDYLAFMIAILACTAFSLYASARVKSSFSKNDMIRSRRGLTGYDAVSALMRANGINDIAIGSVNGTLTDHYNPSKEIINLSESTYGSSSIAAVAVAAHEMGHVMQKKEEYGLYKLRTALVPVVNFGSHLAMPLVFIGLLIDWFSMSLDQNTGFYVALVGVILYGSSFLFALVTLPVEINASRRAKKMLVSAGIIYEDELPAASDVLSAAAMTYLASTATSLVYFLRFLVQVLSMFGRRNRR